MGGRGLELRAGNISKANPSLITIHHHSSNPLIITLSAPPLIHRHHYEKASSCIRRPVGPATERCHTPRRSACGGSHRGTQSRGDAAGVGKPTCELDGTCEKLDGCCEKLDRGGDAALLGPSLHRFFHSSLFVLSSGNKRKSTQMPSQHPRCRPPNDTITCVPFLLFERHNETHLSNPGSARETRREGPKLAAVAHADKPVDTAP
ncbi:hypothetical protein B0J13DRAFT_227521 [Dactylonectria estremocensis]|uniref:Uncharacterized protein n=1 Tax=Dactylonectria estremocensis TaxID=1079267 RepID=A0A9P9F8X2_9HYPO|nr:hypothetical protein B0J13DRAFT_227521 [Dactylonectria estremocensis]